MEKDTKQPSWITWLVIVAIIAATVWYYSDARKSASDLYKEGNVATLLKRAEKGDAAAQYFIGWSYLEGTSKLEKNIPLARESLQKALAQGYARAGLMLYLMDDGRTYSRAEYYAYIHQTQGKHAAEAIAKAAPKWLEQGIILGDSDSTSLSLLNGAYTYRGYPMERAAELIPALHAMEKTQTLGRFHNELHELLGMLYFAEQDYANALTYLEKETKNPSSNPNIAYRLGRMYEEGLGVARDERKAREMYASVPLKDNGALYGDAYRLILWHLAMMQAQGRGGDVDKKSAAELLQKLESKNRSSPAVLGYPSAEQMDALREAIAAP